MVRKIDCFARNPYLTSNTVANLPAEIQHLLEEIQAKDRVVQECRTVIQTRDNSIQKFLKMNGAGQANPKEESYCKNVLANFDRAQIVQEEKVGLSEKAAILVGFLSSCHSPDLTKTILPAGPPNQTPRLQNSRPPKRRLHSTRPPAPLASHQQHTSPTPLRIHNRSFNSPAPPLRQRRPLHNHSQQPHSPTRRPILSPTTFPSEHSYPRLHSNSLIPPESRPRRHKPLTLLRSPKTPTAEPTPPIHPTHLFKPTPVIPRPRHAQRRRHIPPILRRPHAAFSEIQSPRHRSPAPTYRPSQSHRHEEGRVVAPAWRGA